MQDTAHSQAQAATQSLGQLGKILARQGLKKAGAWLAGALAPLLPFLLMMAGVFVAIVLVVGAVFYAMPQTVTKDSSSSSSSSSSADRRVVQADQALADKYNVANTWLVSGVTDVPGDRPEVLDPPPGGWYAKAVGTKLGRLADRYGTDREQAFTWGFLRSADLFYALNGGGQVDTAGTEKIADVLKPYFYYQCSAVVTTSTVQGKSKTSSQTVYLLLEAGTYKGHYLYKYRWETKAYTGKGWSEEVRYEALDHVVTLSTWERFDQAMRTLYQVQGNTVDSMRLAEKSIIEAGLGFTSGSSQLDWLLAMDLGAGGMYLAGPAPTVTDAEIVYQPVKHPAAVIAFLKGRNSALAERKYLDLLNQAALPENLNPLFLLAVTGAEQGLVPMTGDWRQVLENPFNVSGGSGPGSWQTFRPGFAVSASIAARTLAADSLGCPSGWSVVEWIEAVEPDGSQRPDTGGYYGAYAQAPGSWTSPDWIVDVSSLYGQLENIGD